MQIHPNQPFYSLANSRDELPQWLKEILSKKKTDVSNFLLKICFTFDQVKTSTNQGFWALYIYFEDNHTLNMPVIFNPRNVDEIPVGLQDILTSINQYFFQSVNYTDVLLKRTMQELESKNEELKKANTELDRFVYSASHDLRAPLTSVLGLVYLLKEKDADQDKNLYLDLMIESIGKLDGTIRDIVAYSKNNKTEIKNESINLKRLLEPIIVQLSNIEARNINLFERVKIINDFNFIGDWSRLQIVFYNLMSNSVKYRSLARELEIVIDLVEQPETIEITFSDNGIGIDSLYINKIFDMFYRSNEKSTGAGLGLFVVKEIVDKLKGRINVYSAPDMGSTFKILLPKTISY